MSARLTDAERETLDEEFGDGFTVAWCRAIDHILTTRLAAITAATDDAARQLGHAHPAVVALRAALGGGAS